MDMEKPASTWVHATAIIVYSLALSGCVFAQSTFRTRQSDSDDLARGKFLIAPRESQDPNFAGAVVLLIHYDDDGAVGLVINRPTKLPLSQLFDEIKAARKIHDVAYFGGPVELRDVLALCRSKKRPEASIPMFGDVYLLSTKAGLEKALSSKPTPKTLRVYVGYTGWAPGQLERELDLGAWRVLPGEEESIFDADPAGVWPRLIDRTEMRVARLAAWH
jgi:putative transcriptional regulator